MECNRSLRPPRTFSRAAGSAEDLEGVQEQLDREEENKKRWYKERKIKRGRERIRNLVSAPFGGPAFES
jgi:hypothetical protein